MKLRTFRFSFKYFLSVSIGVGIFFLMNIFSSQASGGLLSIKYVPEVMVDESSEYRALYSIKPLGEEQGKVLVMNFSDQPQSVQVYPVDATTTTSGSFALQSKSSPQIGVGSWVTMDSEVIELKPYENKEIGYTLKLPKNIGPGDYAGGIIVQSVAGEGGSGISVEARVGLRMYVSVPGEVEVKYSWGEGATQAEKQKDTSSYYHKFENNSHVFYYKLANDGNVNLSVKGSLEVSNLLLGGKVLGASDSRDGSVLGVTEFDLGTLAPRTLETKKMIWEGTPSAGIFKAKTVLSLSRLSFNSEKYTPQTLTRTLTFVVVPWTFIFSVLFVIIGALSAWWLYKKRKEAFVPYSVVAGDTIVLVAQKFQLDVRRLIMFNDMNPPYQLYINQVLKLPMTKKQYRKILEMQRSMQMIQGM